MAADEMLAEASLDVYPMTPVGLITGTQVQPAD
jgi:hypothetical protein